MDASVELVDAAHEVRRAVAATGGRLTRRVLTERLRESGKPISIARASELLRSLKAGDEHE